MTKIEEIFSKIEEKVIKKEQELKEYNATMKFDINGEQGGNWVLDFRPDTFGVRKDDIDCDCTISTSDINFIKLTKKELKPEWAIISGKLKLSGNIALAMELAKLFK